MNQNTLIETGCDGGSIIVSSKCINGVFFYQLSSYELFTSSNSKTIMFVSLDDAWSFLKNRYEGWNQLYLIQIDSQMTDLVKREYILTDNKNEYTINSWLEQLTGRGIGF